MSTDINAAFGHRVPFPPTETVVAEMRKGIHPVNPAFGSGWDLLPDHDPGFGLVYVRGPLRIYFGPHSAIIGTGWRWPRPGEHGDEKESLVSAVCAIARHFESPHVIFLPSDLEPWCSVFAWIGEGLALDQIQQRLAGIRKPSTTFQETLKQRPDCYEINGYVIKELDPKAA